MDFQQVFSLIFHPKIILYLDEDVSFEFSQLQRNFSFQNAIFDAQNEDLFTYFLSSSFNHKPIGLSVLQTTKSCPCPACLICVKLLRIVNQ